MSIHFLNVPSVYRFGTKWAGVVPSWILYPIARFVAELSYVFYSSAARNAKNNLKRVFPAYSPKEISAIAIRLFRNYSMYLVDYCRFTNLSSQSVIDKLVSFEGRDNLENAIRMNKGIILLTAHLGNWELGGIFFGNCGVKTNVITLNDSNEEIDGVRRWYREKHRVSTISIGNSPFAMIDMVAALGRGEVLAMLIDRHHQGTESLSADFLGSKSFFPRGPFILSRLTGAPIVTGFVVKDALGYKGIVGQPLIVSDEADEQRALGEVIKTFEHYIIMYADQWYNFVSL